MTDNRKYYVEEFGGKLVEILEVYESFSGWYWFITEKEKEPIETDEGTDFVYFGKVYGLDTEWGDIWMGDLHKEMRRGQVWKVPQSNWWSISHVTVKHIGPKKETPSF
ncbi:MAG TPA: hypothetical protein VL854_06765 [Nitrososphaeraceae archaeon]|nr:hypothetical protein [Nitrososphaeraceae archaeon]